GWPMNVFLTPDQKPFFAGTYFPPESRWGKLGFKDILLAIAKLWREDRDRIYTSSESLSKAVEQLNSLAPPTGHIPLETVSNTANQLADMFDKTNGGIGGGGTNKFPPSMTMGLMLREYRRTEKLGKPKRKLLELVTLTLDNMANGGIYDHLGGGIARYSTDPHWLVPHFEKMLYDQALVSGIYLEAYELTQNDRYADVAKDIFDYVITDLQSPRGGFYSSRDADSEGAEGKYYVWSKSQVMSTLGRQTGELFCSYYDVTDEGNWEGQNILNIQRDIETVARLHRIEPCTLKTVLAEARTKLLTERMKRVPPGLDDKVLTAWNGLMIASLAHGGRVLSETKYTEAAVRAADFILDQLSSNGRLLRSYRNGRAHTFGFADDYAFFIAGLLELYQTTFETRWLKEAIRLNQQMIEYFWDKSDGVFFFIADDAEKVIIRTKDIRDGVIPSSNSVSLMNLLCLSLILDREDLRHKAERIIEAFSGNIRQSPIGFERFLTGVLFCHSAPSEIVIMGSPNHAATQALIQTVQKVYDPYKIVLLLDPTARDARLWQKEIPLLQGKVLLDNKPTAYLCRNRVCKKPTTSTDELLKQLRAN
ncbi:MAG: thioredoxin domain-containing protein, partial [Planctomycetota bacterium]